MTSTTPKTFFITGVSSGFGRSLAVEALAAGHRVVGTVRNAAAATAFTGLHEGRAFAKILDVTDHAGVAAIVADVEAEIGAIDVLVNNAGYGMEGVIEESSMDDLRRQFEVNVFGAVAVIQAVLPFMRRRHAGHIVNITSMGGHDLRRPGLLSWEQIRARRHLRDLGQGGKGLRHRRHRGRAGHVPDRLVRSLHDPCAPIDRRLRRHVRAHARGPRSAKRQTEWRSTHGGPRHPHPSRERHTADASAAGP
jgi:NAD(P)-dependent dehydrogenase (short-subunit alcohol dehydrogenase family)